MISILMIVALSPHFLFADRTASEEMQEAVTPTAPASNPGDSVTRNTPGENLETASYGPVDSEGFPMKRLQKSVIAILLIAPMAHCLLFPDDPASKEMRKGAALMVPAGNREAAVPGDLDQKPDKPVPEPPAKPWKCTVHQVLPDGLVAKEADPPAGLEIQPGSPALDGNSSFRNQGVPIPFAEFEHIIRLDEMNHVFVWAVTEKTLPAIDKQHQRIVQPVFGPSDEPGAWHYVFSIRNFKADEITVISIPIPPDMMVEVQGGERARAPGWIAISTRKMGANTPTLKWLKFSADE